MRISAIFAAALTALGVTATPGIVSAQTVELKFASSAPPTSPWAKQIDRFAAYMDAETKGGVKISPFYNSQLGSENDAIAQVSRGRLDMGSFTAASVALQVPEIALVQLPFYFNTGAQRDCVLDNHAQKPMTEALAKKGLRFLRWGEVGAVHLPGKKAYVTPADVRGIKVGVVTNKLNNEFWKAMGANPVPTAIAEVSSSMQTGLIDTYPTPFAFYVPSGLNKIAPTMTKFPLWDAAGVTLMNLGIYEKLSPEAKAALERETEKYPNSLYRAEIRGVDAALTNVTKGAGGTVIETTPEQRAEWQKVLGHFWSTMAKEMGPEGEKFFSILEAGKKSCENAK